MKILVSFILCLITAILADEIFIVPQGVTNIHLSTAIFATDAAGNNTIDLINLPTSIELKVIADGDYTLSIDSLPAPIPSIITSLEVGGSTGTQTVNINTALGLTSQLTVNANGALVVNEALTGDASANIVGSVQQNADFVLNGAINVQDQGSLLVNAGELGSNVAINILAGASLTTSGTNTLTLTGAGVTVAGVFTQQNSAQLNINAPIVIENAGTLNINGGATLSGSASIVNRGTAAVNAAASLDVAFSQEDNGDAQLNINNALNVAASAALTLASGAVQIAADVALNINTDGTLNLGNAILQGDGSLNVAGALNWSNGQINLSGATTIQTSGQLMSSGGTTLAINNGQLLVQGTWSQQNTARVILNVDVTIDGLMSITGDAAISGTGRLINNNNINIDNNLNLAVALVNNANINMAESITVTSDISQDNADAQINLNDRVVFTLNTGATLGLLQGSLVGNGVANLLVVADGAILNLSGAMSGTLNAQISGTLNLAGSINVAGNIDIAGNGNATFISGNIIGDGSLNIMEGASLVTSPTADETLVIAKSLRIMGNWNFESAGSVELNDDAVIESGGKALLDAEGTITGSGSLNVNGDAVLNLRQGTLNVNTRNNGRINVLSNSVFNSNLVQVNGDARILINPAVTLTLGGNKIMELRAGLLATGDLPDSDANAGAAATLVVASGSTLKVNGISSVSSNLIARIDGELVLEGDLSNENDIDVFGTFTWNSGRLDGSGTLRIQNGGVLRCSGSENLESNKNIVILGKWEQQNSANLVLNGNTNIEAGGSAVLAAVSVSGSGSIVNNGQLTLNTASRLGLPFTNNAQLFVSADLAIGATFAQSTSDGASIELNNAVLTTENGVIFTLEGGVITSKADSSILVEEGSTFDMSVEGAIEGVIDVVVQGTFLQTGDMTNQGEIQVSGRFFWRSGENSGSGGFIVLANGRLETTNDEDEIVLGANRELIVRGTWVHSASTTMVANANMIIEDGGSFTTSADGSINSGLENPVQFIVQSGGSADFNHEASYNLIIFNNGKTAVRNVNVVFRSMAQEGDNAIFLVLDSNIKFTSDAEVRFERGKAYIRGTLTGAGIVFAGTVTLNPGDNDTQGKVVLDGDMYLEEGSTIVIEVENLETHDRIEVTGTLFLRGGSVRFELLGDASAPSAGQNFEFITYANKEGDFEDYSSEGEFTVDFQKTEDGSAAVVTSTEGDVQEGAASNFGYSTLVMGIVTIAAFAAF
mmetsp:Transcript_6365/g.23971  ORF Transcript_6365/g.23971 Transcript_6365/m.23971 type:complete len:1234 (-) Transcript_6365:126-3827(-)|eukprot:CAMPEP_0117437230 /NCGR_PEP_ID=MMETSP0759-20121206/1417_1 /TAXON_ID=63605 /ORGANISM="Percolomonas cosmopolitus, Strain WS" /LENGTH=1233 /DNA_ID=CAMNT_0005228857 /DNA_START=3800 /DNA_END=7501 /DNA_ORIENTATION=-